MMHVAKVSEHSYNIVNRNNQFKGMRFRSLQELRAATSHIVTQYVQQWNEDVFESIVNAVVSNAKEIILLSQNDNKFSNLFLLFFVYL